MVTAPGWLLPPSSAGLSSANAAERLARYGANELPRARRTPLWRLVAVSCAIR